MDTVTAMMRRASSRNSGPDGSEAAVRKLLQALGEWGVAEERSAPPASLDAYYRRARAAYRQLAEYAPAARAA